MILFKHYPANSNLGGLEILYCGTDEKNVNIDISKSKSNLIVSYTVPYYSQGGLTISSDIISKVESTIIRNDELGGVLVRVMYYNVKLNGKVGNIALSTTDNSPRILVIG